MGTLRLQSLKMLFVFLIPLLGFVHGTCWFDKLCKEDELTGENQLELATKKNAKACQDACEGNVDCNFFEYKEFQDEGDCYLLKACTKEVENKNPHFNAGPKKCEEIKDFCPEIKTDSKVFWHCVDKDDDELDPKKPPENSKCYTNCRGDVRESKCEKDPENSNKLSWKETSDPKLGTPDEEDANCDCDPIKLEGKIPNKEAGTLLHCKKSLTYCDDEHPAKITSEDAPCHLFCYDIEQLSFHCEDGEWKTDIHEIEDITGDNLYCYNKEDTDCDQE